MAKKTPAAAPAAPATEVVETAHGEVEMTAEDKQVAAEIRRHAQSTAAPDVTGFLSPEEQVLKKQIDEALAKGEDPFGDDEPIVRTQEEADEANAAEAAAKAAAAPADPEDEPDEVDEASDDTADAEAAAEDEPSAEALAAVAGEEAPAAEAKPAAVVETPSDEELPAELVVSAPALVKTEDPKTLADAREAAQTKIDEIEAKWTKQELTDEQRVEQLKAARREESAAVRAEARNDAAMEANQANVIASHQRVIEGIKTIGKREGTLDYAKDEKAGKQFDHSIQILAGDPDNKDKTFGEIALAAHRMVCAMRGVAPKAAAAPAAAPAVAKPSPGKPPARVAPKAPITLRDLPTAATPNTGGDTLSDQLGRLKGQAFEAAWARLTPAQRDQYLND